MNDGDVYVLDTKYTIYVWVGRNSNNIEKLQGAKVSLDAEAVRLCVCVCVCVLKWVMEMTGL